MLLFKINSLVCQRHVCCDDVTLPWSLSSHRTLVAELVEHQVAMQEVLSLAPATQTLGVPERSSVSHGYGLRSGTARQCINSNRLLRTDRFITFKYG